jgi:hypothetical protein
MAEPNPSDDPPEDHYEPSMVEVNRARQQGLGVGARDLQIQRDPEPPYIPSAEDETEEEES